MATIHFTLIGKDPFDTPDVTSKPCLFCSSPCVNHYKCIDLDPVSDTQYMLGNDNTHIAVTVIVVRLEVSLAFRCIECFISHRL